MQLKTSDAPKKERFILRAVMRLTVLPRLKTAPQP